MYGNPGKIHYLDYLNAPVQLLFNLFKGAVVTGQPDGNPVDGRVLRGACGKTCLLYTSDGICDTWEVLANMIYPGGLTALKKRSGGAYMEIGKAKSEWAAKIGIYLDLANNQSPSFQYFINSLKIRIEAA